MTLVIQYDEIVVIIDSKPVIPALVPEILFTISSIEFISAVHDIVCQHDEPCGFSRDHWQMQQCSNVFIDLYKVLFLVLFHCCILLLIMFIWSHKVIIKFLSDYWNKNGTCLSIFLAVYLVIHKNVCRHIGDQTRVSHMYGTVSQNSEADAKWPPFSRQSFQMHFLL